jgi:Uncharacterized conserved protein (DUF2285)
VGSANQWGIPDWTKQNEYPNRDKTKIDKWAWEFLRRWPDYRNFWTENVKPFIGTNGFIHRDAAGNFWPHLDDLISRFGVDLPSPPYDSTPSNFVSSYIRYVTNDGRDFQRLQLKEDEIAIIIDLARPLKPQLERAHKSAAHEQKFRQLNQKSVRIRVDHYVRYLRILDADESRARPRNIAELLFPHLPGPPENSRMKALHDNRSVARYLRDGGYLSLLR